MDDQITMFCAFTSASPEQAQQYLQLTDNNLEQAVQLFFNNPDLGASPPSTAAASSQPAATRDDPITIPDDEVEDDEAMARRLQEEMYGGAGGGGGARDADDVRAPMARTTETLVGPGGDWRDDPSEMRAAVMQQMMNRQSRRAAPGIFNQANSPSIWAQDDPNDPERHREVLSRATGGASDATSKSNHLANLFRPPFDLIAPMSWSEARDEGKENEKWVLINLQDPSIFDCQVLNRDLWKDAKVVEAVKEHFIFLQYNKDDPRGQEYIQYYFANMRDNEDAYPHIAIVDPRTGEQVKTWSGSPAPKAEEFLMDIYEFLDRYTLRMDKKNPVQTKKKERKKEVAQMSEEEMLEMALQNSLNANGASSGLDIEQDPDALTDKGKSRAMDSEAMDTTGTGLSHTNGSTEPAGLTAGTASVFSQISSSHPHEEPPVTEKDSTRIQFRYSGGRVVRRFLLSDPVSRIYEWLKAAPLEGTEGKDLELVAVPRTNLIDMLDVPIGQAGLKNGTVMVEVVSDDDE